eukprot:6371076-Prymnesium_polylepis.1
MPGHATDRPRPTRPTHPHKACEERKQARSLLAGWSSCTLLFPLRRRGCRLHCVAAGPVAGVIREVVQLRSAVDEVAGDFVH